MVEALGTIDDAVVLARAASQAWPDWRLSNNIPPLAATSCAADDATLRKAAALWLAEEAALHPGLDARGQAAFAMGSIVFGFASHLACATLSTGRIPALTSQSTSLWPERFTWTHGAESGVGLRFRYACAPETPWVTPTPELIARTLDALTAPVASALRETSRLGLPALRRLVADMLASGFLHLGRLLGREDEAMALASAALAVPGVSFANPDTGFQLVTVPADGALPELSRWFPRRGGCCRWYTVGENEKCGTCVHLTADEQHARLAQHLRDEVLAERAAEEPAA